MITDEEIIQNTVQSYEDVYGLNYNQEILTRISLDENMFSKDNVVTVLDIFLFEHFDNDECYNDPRHEFINEKYLREHPEEIRKLVEENEEKYRDGGKKDELLWSRI